ncbi:Uncharacterised protein [Rodentibacter pneumotropicus]|uniref:Uncharacterized protein n=1 Tax=Rodentibacter pneumotropicus TaxID=758 RepID=A0A3S4VGP4_9PAST|nr:Uncharacterised protein [Rodentibacter pneumotropicus]
MIKAFLILRKFRDEYFKVLNNGDSRLYEPSMSAMLGYLLDSNEDHGLGSIFVKRFLKEVSAERFNDFWIILPLIIVSLLKKNMY